MQEGQAQMDLLIGREKGLFGSAADTQGLNKSGFDLSQSINRDSANQRQNQWRTVSDLTNQGAIADRDAVQKYIQSILGARNEFTDTQSLNKEERNSNVFNTVSNLPYEDIFKQLIGMFGSGR